MIGNIKIGDKIVGNRLQRRVTGIVVRIHPGAVVVENIKNREELIVIDSDRIIKIFKHGKNNH
jgi:hypothetical protein